MRGNGTNCIRIVPYSAVQFGSYNLYKRVCFSAVLRQSGYEGDAEPDYVNTFGHSFSNPHRAPIFHLYEGWSAEV